MIRKTTFNRNIEASDENTINVINLRQVIWSHLSRYESADFVKERLLKQGAGKDKVKIKTSQITSTIRQAKNYYLSAYSSDFSVKPLILYYGMEGLAKALILLGNNDYTLSSNDIRAHGLKSENNRNNNVRKYELADEYCIIEILRDRRSGTIKNLGLFNTLRKCYSDKPIDNVKFTVKNLLSLFPENYRQYYDFYKTPPNSWKVRTVSQPSSSDEILNIDLDEQNFSFKTHKKQFKIAPNCAKSFFPDLKTNYIERYGPPLLFDFTGDLSLFDNRLYVSHLLSSERYILNTLHGYRMSDIDIHFMLMFILSYIVRYKQDNWALSLSRQIDSYGYFLIENFIQVSEIKFPLLILQELDDRIYDFRP